MTERLTAVLDALAAALRDLTETIEGLRADLPAEPDEDGRTGAPRPLRVPCPNCQGTLEHGSVTEETVLIRCRDCGAKYALDSREFIPQPDHNLERKED